MLNNLITCDVLLSVFVQNKEIANWSSAIKLKTNHKKRNKQFSALVKENRSLCATR